MRQNNQSESKANSQMINWKTESQHDLRKKQTEQNSAEMSAES